MKSFMFALLALGSASGVAHAQVPGAPQCVNRDDGSSICINDRVLDYRDATGTITAIYNDLTAVVVYDGGDINTVDLQYVSREVSCIYGYCAGDEVLDASNDNAEGTITDLYENGMAEVTDDDGETYYYVEVNKLTSLGESITINYNWATPRPYPDVTVYSCFFPAPDNRYGWPDGYPYPRPIFGRQLHGIFPMPPQHLGSHGFDPYPFQHPVQWQGGGRNQVNFGNQHPGFAPGQPGRQDPGHQGPGGFHPEPQPIRPDPRPQPQPVRPDPRPQPQPDPRPQPQPVRPDPQPIRPQPQPDPRPQPQPVRPDPQPIRPQPQPDPRPQPQPVRPDPQPVRPQPQPEPVRPQPQPEPVRPGNPGGGQQPGGGGEQPGRGGEQPGGGGGPGGHR